MPTLPPRSVSYPDHSDRCYRALCLPNGTCTYLPPDYPRLGSEFDPFQYVGWDPASRKGLEAEVTDLTDDEIREICRLEPAERDAFIARLKAEREAAEIRPADRPVWIVCVGSKIRADSVRGILRVARNAIEIVWEGGRSKQIVCADEAEADRVEARICSMIPGLADLGRKAIRGLPDTIGA